MAWKTQTSGYVKFLRGTPDLWAEITVKDNDTLYFISETNSSTGRLYLGEKLISGGGEGGATSLADLEDVIASELGNASYLLVYNPTTSKWEPRTIANIISQYISTMTGASANSDGVGGLVPQPLQGQEGLFLRGDGTWANPVSNVENTLDTLIGNDAGMSMREVANEAVAGLVANAPEAFDTLKEIADWIGTQEGGATADIVTLQNAVFGTENTDGLTDLVPVIQNDIDGLTVKVSDLEDDMESLDSRLRWQNIVADE